MYFRDLNIGDVFRFQGEAQFPATMEQGPWIKESPRKYRHATKAGRPHTVGTTLAVVTKGEEKPSVLLERKLVILVSGSLTDAEMESLIDAVEDEVSMGLDAIGRNVVEKFGAGQLSFKVEE
jgi:hypothetical protein